MVVTGFFAQWMLAVKAITLQLVAMKATVPQVAILKLNPDVSTTLSLVQLEQLVHKVTWRY